MSQDSTLLHTGWPMWVMLVLVTGIAALFAQRFLLLPARQILTAVLRALAQMLVVALAISQLSRSWWLTVLFLLLMFVVAALTSTRRIGALAWWGPGIAIAAGVLPVVGVMLAFGVLPLSSLALVAVVGQLIGGAMSATSLAGRRIRQELKQRHGEVEAALALGLPPAQARSLVGRPVAAEALFPGLDQTRTVGTVTLPGAFVGLVLGGASPLDAGLVQLIVLINLLAVQAVAVTVVAVLVERGTADRPERTPGAKLAVAAQEDRPVSAAAQPAYPRGARASSR